MGLLTGDSLISSGDDGAARFWKKSLSGEWLEFAETDMAAQ
jgi:nucleoporin SEH1